MARTATRSSRYGRWGKQLKLMEAFISWGNDERVQESLQEADTRADFAEFLIGAIRSATLRGYQAANPQWDRYMGIESAQDFREHRARGLAGMAGIAHVGELGEYKEMRRAKRPVPTYAVDTYGGVYALTRHLIINDDLRELLQRTPQDMGRAMGTFVARTGIALVEGNPTAPDGAAVFNVTRGNDSVAALSEDSLADAFTWMENQVDENGDQITMTPTTLAVKSLRMQLIAKRIVRSQDTGSTVNYTGGTAGVGTDRFDKGTINPLAGMLPEGGVIRDPYWSDANNWYLFADPGVNPAFIMAFLQGERDPFVGLKNPEVRGALPGVGEDPYTYELDTIDFKVRHDFGAAVADPRAAYRSIVP
jgi:hypothetical protein